MTADEALRRWNILEKIGMGIHAIPRMIERKAVEAFGPEARNLTWAQQLGRTAGRNAAMITGAGQGTESPISRNLLNRVGGFPNQPPAATTMIPRPAIRPPASTLSQLQPGQVRIGGGPIENVGSAIARLDAQRAQIPGYTGDDMAMALNRRYLEATRANAVRYGLQPGLTDEEKLASLTAKWNRTHDTAKRQAILQEAGPIQANIDQKNALARGEQQTQQLATKLGIPLEEARIQAGARGASDMTRLAGDVITEAGRNRATQLSALDRAMLSPEERQARKNEIEGDYQAMVKGLQRFGIGGQEEGRPEQTTAQGNSADLNNDGRVSPEEQQYNFAVTQLKNNKLLTPAERARLEAKRKELEPKILGVPAANA